MTKARLGYALLCLADNQDLGQGPIIRRQVFNPRPIDPGMLKKISHNKSATGLSNRELAYALKIAVQPNYIETTSLSMEMKSTAYSNFVKWTSKVEPGNSEIFLLNGNHRTTFMQEDFAPFTVQLVKAKQDFRLARSPRECVDAQKKIDDITMVLRRDCVWLIEFYDIGK